MRYLGPRSFRSPSRHSESISNAGANRGEIRFGEGDDWLEILGCGMVHPNVMVGIAVSILNQFQGFAGHRHRPHRQRQQRRLAPARSSKPIYAGRRIYGFCLLDLPTLAGGLMDEPRDDDTVAEADMPAYLLPSLRAFPYDHPGFAKRSMLSYVKHLAGITNTLSAPNVIGRSFQIIDNKVSGLLHPYIDDHRARHFRPRRPPIISSRV